MKHALLMNCLSSRSGGAVAYLRQVLGPLQDHLSQQGVRLVLLLRDDQQCVAGIKVDRVTVPATAVAGVRRALWERRHLRKVLQDQGCTLLFTPYQIATRVPGVANVVMLRNMEPFFSRDYLYSPASRLRNEILRVQSRRCLAQAEAVIAVSDFAGDYAREKLGVPAEKITRIHHGRDEAFNALPTAEDRQVLRELGLESPYIFSCGSLLPYRRLEDILQAFARLSSAGLVDARLVIAGTGTDRRYDRLITALVRDSPARDRIRNLGHVDFRAMPALYRNSRVFVTATEVEACPNIAIEALASGCTVLSAETLPLREILADAACYFPQRDIPALTAELASLWKNPELREPLAARAVQRGSGFDWSATAAATSALLAGLMH